MERPHMLLAYDADGNVIATLDYLVASDADGNATGLVDFAAHEAAGGEHTDIWTVASAKGSKVWPEWLGAAAHNFKVELRGKPGKKRLTALVHKTSGYRRSRAALEAAIKATPLVDGARDIRHLVGGPGKPLTLDDEGKTAPPPNAGTPKHLPLIAR